MDEHGGDIEKALKEYHLKEDALIDFSASINPLGMPYSARKAIIDRLSYCSRYPEPEYNELKKHLADFYGVAAQEILPDNGSISLIYLIPRALGLTKPGIPMPTFSEYGRASRLFGSQPLFIKSQEDLSFDVDAIIKCLTQGKIDSLYLCNPNNPTGLSLPKEIVLRIIKTAKKKKITVIVDEVFVEFTDTSSKHSVIEEARNFKNVVMLRSMTKYFGLAGVRLGIAIANEQVIRRLKVYQPPWAVNVLAVSAAIALLNNAKYIRDSHNLILREKKFLHDSLSRFTPLESPVPLQRGFVTGPAIYGGDEIDKVSIPYRKGGVKAPSFLTGFTLLQVWKPSANFILCRIKDKKLKAAALRNRLVKRGILIRDCANFPGLNSSFFRVAVRKRQDNLLLLKMLHEVLG